MIKILFFSSLNCDPGCDPNLRSICPSARLIGQQINDAYSFDRRVDNHVIQPVSKIFAEWYLPLLFFLKIKKNWTVALFRIHNGWLNPQHGFEGHWGLNFPPKWCFFANMAVWINFWHELLVFNSAVIFARTEKT